MYLLISDGQTGWSCGCKKPPSTTVDTSSCTSLFIPISNCKHKINFFYASEIDSDEPYRDPALVVEGCNEKRNAIYRSGLIQEVQEFIQEYLDAISQFSSGSGSGQGFSYT